MEDHFSGSSLLSHHKKQKSFDDQIKRIKKASEIAQDKIDYYTAHNESVLQAIEVVENFLRKYIIKVIQIILHFTSNTINKFRNIILL